MNSYSMERMPLCEWNARTDAWLGNHDEEEEEGKKKVEDRDVTRPLFSGQREWASEEVT